MEDPKELLTIQIGGLARKALEECVTGTVMGVTSKGAFLNTQDRIFFLTTADYKSPYNIQVSSLTEIDSQLTVGDKWQVENSILIFPSSSIRIDINRALVWQPAPMAQINTDRTTQSERITGLIRRLCELDPNKGWIFLADCEGSSGLKQNPEAQRINRLTGDFLSSFSRSDKIGCLENARSVLGLGGGLTPSGDDWLTGFLLFHARRNQALQRSDSFLNELNVSITTKAFERTTKISANRIEAACRGWAEELFLEVIDSLLISEKSLSDEKTIRLANFGHSSGVDTCMGILAAFKTI